MRKKYIPFICIIVISFVLFFAVLFTNTKKTKVITFRKNYDISSFTTEEDHFKIDLFINNKKSYFVDKKQLEECFITSEDRESIINLTLDEIKDNESSLKYSKDKYYNYTFDFKINLKIDSLYNWNINKAYLVLKYSDNLLYTLNIGNVTYNKFVETENETFTITNIKAVTTNLLDNVYLSGIMIGLRNLSNTPFTIDKINVMNGIINTGKEIKELDHIYEENDFTKIAGYDFSQSTLGDGTVNKVINDDKTHYFFIPLFYNDNLILNKFPLEFIITKDGQTKSEYLINYVYYEVQTENIKKDNIHIYDIK